MNSSRKILFFGEKNPPTYHEVPPENEKLYQQILQTKQQISDEQRFENIIALNAYQEHLLAEKNIGVLGQDHDASRKLVAILSRLSNDLRISFPNARTHAFSQIFCGARIFADF